MASWEYQGEEYEGCSETPDWKGHDWCYVKGGDQCATALDSVHDGEERKYRECEEANPCACMTSWEYKGEEYEGCSETPGWKGHRWCYVKGGDQCGIASDSV